jgi:hypothetical protein
MSGSDAGACPADGFKEVKARIAMEAARGVNYDPNGYASKRLQKFLKTRGEQDLRNHRRRKGEIGIKKIGWCVSSQ